MEIIGILGPTASGKTDLAVALAKGIQAEVISADSRQVYKGMDIGTGKDLEAYEGVPYHLIDIIEPGEKYNVSRFQSDFLNVVKEDKRYILCGGTGLYIQALVQGFEDTQIPEDLSFRDSLKDLSVDELSEMGALGSTKKRMIRYLEKERFLKENPDYVLIDYPSYSFRLYGLNPPVEHRRSSISARLKYRLQKQDLLGEVESLVAQGVEHEMLEYYGLEYKYVSLFLRGFLRYDEMYDRLETEIHRFAKRQMTFFRSMEKKGIEINWIPFELSLEEKVEYIKKRGL
ncbi:tRNA (adenosine(37)-N6)-dimethylallyltransferase [Leadbetterella byssophila]|uniref:tRNA (adenosine(37)-N6)-dimethylallyltransferase n=1 Tax=Leadbetterella byssophila TaxID=316068 RepID=UPI0039A0BD10